MAETRRKFLVVGLTHIDLAWKKTRQEHREIFEAAILRLLDVLDRNPGYTYLIEQAAHYRTLAETRPDLIERLRAYLQEGRLEFAGGLASTLETNGPSGENFVRNQLLGFGALRDLFGIAPSTGYLIDTFGIHAQVPQILRQFGLSTLLANRFGGAQDRDVFIARGLDGTRLLVAGRDVYSPHVMPERVFFEMTESYGAIDTLFRHADKYAADGPTLVMPYTEYCGIASLHIAEQIAQRNAGAADGEWKFATLQDFFTGLAAQDTVWPEQHGDLNPEFTGTFGLRPGIRAQHRAAGVALLEAEKWATLLGLANWREDAQEAWWKIAYVESHDVYSGSHPTAVYDDAIAQLADVTASAGALTARCAQTLATSGQDDELTLIAMNGLPWSRDAVVRVALPDAVDPLTITRVRDETGDVPFEVEDHTLILRAQFAGVSAKRICVATAPAGDPARAISKPGELVRKQIRTGDRNLVVTADDKQGLLISVADDQGETIQTIGVGLVLQEDRGNFQIETFVAHEVSALVGAVSVEGPTKSALRERMTIRGSFPRLWTKTDNPLNWQITCSLYPGRPGVDLDVAIDWRGETSRVRLKVTTGFKSSTGIFEIPFGAVERAPYHSRGTAKGEWPVHRWVAVEEGGRGVALINRGHVGAEVAGGAIWQTLLRAPVGEYAGMVTDDSSSQHGRHSFQFSVLPYAGSWKSGASIAAGQDLNVPVQTCVVPTGELTRQGSLIEVSSPAVVLSAVKAPENTASDDVILRLYEATGQHVQCNVFLRDAREAWLSDLAEADGPSLVCVHGQIALDFAPFEIKTIRVRTEKGPSGGS